MDREIDFTGCPIDLTANYGGSDKKRGILYQGNRYMLKMSDRIPEEKRISLNSSYSNSAYSEYISCHILETLGFDVQKTLIGTLTMFSSKGERKIYPTVACKNFIPEGYDLVEFKFIESTLLDTKPPKTPKLSDVYEVLSMESVYFSKDMAKKALERFWDTFIADALLGNFDRHANNWGYLVNRKTNEISLAPVYDCGSCLYPQMADEAMSGILSSKDEMQMRIEKFPQAALEDDNGKKISYKKFISSFENPDCTDALIRIVPRIDIGKIKEIIDNTPGISDIRKTFYLTMLSERYRQILLEPYQEYLKKRQQLVEETNEIEF